MAAFSQPEQILQNWRTRLISGVTTRSYTSARKIFEEINPHLEFSPIMDARPRSYRDAAVLVPIIDHATGPTLLLTVRSSDMPSHAGQISFPGGKVEEQDENRIATALREAEEEVGIDPSYVEIVGDMGVHFGGKGFAVTPVVGIIHPDANYEPCPREVAEIFEVPLSYLLQADNHTIEVREAKGTKYNMFAVPYQDYHIWGLTAGVINSLVQMMGVQLDISPPDSEG